MIIVIIENWRTRPINPLFEYVYPKKSNEFWKRDFEGRLVSSITTRGITTFG